MEYVLTQTRTNFKFGSTVLQRHIDRHAAEGWQFVTSVFIDNEYHLIWKPADQLSWANRKLGDYKLIPLPGFWARLCALEFGSQAKFVKGHLPIVEPGWRIVAFCEAVGFVLRHEEEAHTIEDPVCDEYSVVEIKPAWWRTFVGSSWRRLVSERLNELAAEGFEIVSCVGGGAFLMRKPRENLAQSSPITPARTYWLAMYEHWFKAAFWPFEIVRWLNELADNGWELVSRYEGAIFLLARST
jgi:hypothetical protein